MELTIQQALQQGVTAHKEGKLQEAERLYQSIIQTQPSHSDANHNLGVLATGLNKIEDALPLFEVALKTNPKIEQYWLSYIDALIRLKRFEIAKQALNDGIKSGLSGEKVNSIQKALEKRLSADANDNEVPSSQQINSLMESYQKGRYAESEKLALEITSQFANHQLGWKVLGAVLSQTGRKYEGLNAFSKVVELAPKDSDAHNNLGILLKELGKFEEAETSYKQAIALKPDNFEAYNNLGIMFRELDRLEDAVLSLSMAIEIKPEYADAHNNLGITLQELNRIDDAETSLRRAVVLNHNFDQARNNLGKLLMKTGRHREGLDEKIKGGGVISFKLNGGVSIL